MGTPKAIADLRQKMGISQRELADRLGVTVTSISRYENGREPDRQVLRRLAEVAQEAKLRQLQTEFEEGWRAAIAEKLDNLPSAGTQRRVSLDDLEYWHWVAKSTFDTVQSVLPHITHPQWKRMLEALQFDQKYAKEQIEVYIHGRKK